MIDERDLSNLFHGTLDTEPSAGAFQRLQIELEHSTRADQRRRGGRILMSRNRMVLLAAGLVMLLIVTVFVGGRVYGRLHPPTGSVPAATPSPSMNMAEVATLLNRPLQFPHLAAKDKCPDGPYTQGMFGTGPAFAGGGPLVADTAWGTYWSVSLATPPSLLGPVVLRGRDLKLGWPLIFIGQDQRTGWRYGVGDIYGTDYFMVENRIQYQAIAFDTANPPAEAYYYFGRKFINWTWQQGFKHGWSGCVGFQLDGPSFTEVFYSSVPGT